MLNFLIKIKRAYHYVMWIGKFLGIKLSMNTLRDIKILSIEFSSVCNLRCKYCSLDKLNRPKYLDIKLYEKLIKEICENPQYKIKVMEWPISGEFFVYPHYKEVIDLTRQYMEKYPKFKPSIILNDNLALLDEEKIELILNSKIITQLICSIDGHDATTFEDMRPPAKFDVIYRNMKQLCARNVELGKPVHIQINNGRDEHSQAQELSDQIKELFDLADSITYWQPTYWNDSFKSPERDVKIPNGFCSFVFNSVTLNSAGYISKCCMDLLGETQYSDFSKSTLSEIWHSPTRKQFLTLMSQGRRKEIEGCRHCTISVTNNDNRYNNISRSIKRKLSKR